MLVAQGRSRQGAPVLWARTAAWGPQAMRLSLPKPPITESIVWGAAWSGVAATALPPPFEGPGG